MTALSAARATQSRNLLNIDRRYQMAASTTIYAGGLVMLKSDGYAVPATASASNQGCVGVAAKTVVNSGADGAAEVAVLCGEFLLNATSIAVTSLNLKVYASDDNTVDETQGTNEPVAGLLIEVVSSTSGWVAVSGELSASL